MIAARRLHPGDQRPALSNAHETDAARASLPAGAVRARRRACGFVVNPRDADRYAFTEGAPWPSAAAVPAHAIPFAGGSAVDYVIVTPDSMAVAYQALGGFQDRRRVSRPSMRTTEWIAGELPQRFRHPETIRTFVIDAYTSGASPTC